jgi:hypothetical protein
VRLDIVAKFLDLYSRKLLVEALDFLEAKNVGLNLLQIGEEVRQPLADRVDVPGGDAKRESSLSLSSRIVIAREAKQSKSRGRPADPGFLGRVAPGKDDSIPPRPSLEAL